MPQIASIFQIYFQGRPGRQPPPPPPLFPLPPFLRGKGSNAFSLHNCLYFKDIKKLKVVDKDLRLFNCFKFQRYQIVKVANVTNLLFSMFSIKFDGRSV